MTQQPALNPWIHRALFGIVGATLLFSIVLDVLLRSNSGLLVMMDIYAVSEADLVQSANGQNAAVNFENFRMEDAGYAQNLYFLGNYAIWPRRLYASSNPMVINTGFELVDQKFLPDDDWVRRHNCAGVISYFIGSQEASYSLPHTKFRPAGENVWIQLR